MPDDPSLLARIVKLEKAFSRRSFFESQLSGLLPTITLGGVDDNERNDKIEKQRDNDCKNKVAVKVSYKRLRSRETTNEDDELVRVCTTYEITTTVTVTEDCAPDHEVETKGTSSHVTEKEFCLEAADGPQDPDKPKTGVSVGFDGKETETLTYPHGTRVVVELKDGRLTIRVTYADGTSTTLVIPEPD